jgi:hypothetical protein
MKMIILLFLLFPFTFIYSQLEIKISYPEPSPSWEIITAKIKYPALAILGGINNSYKVSFSIDSSGVLKNLNINSIRDNQVLDSLFINEIFNVMNAISWDVGNINDKPASMEISMLIVFSTSTKTITSSRKINQVNPYWITSTTRIDSKSNIKIDAITISY